MTKMIFGLLTLACLLCVGDPVAAKDWADYAVPLSPLNGKPIHALAVVDNALYAASGTSLFVLALPGYQVTDVSARLKKQVADEVTDILVDSNRKELWIALNGNTHTAICYDYDIVAKDCDSSFLDRWLGLLEEIRSKGPRSSIQVMVYDGEQAIIGYFKGGVYLYSIRKRTLKLVYEPTSDYHWPVAAVMTKTTAFVATRGDGLIAIDRKRGSATRFPNRQGEELSAVAADHVNLYFGTEGLYHAKIDDFIGRR